MPYAPLESGTYKVNSAGYIKEVGVNIFQQAITVRFVFDRNLVNEIKSCEGARWSPDNKVWTIKNTQRNRWRLRFLASGFKGASFPSPLSRYDSEPPKLERKPRFHRIKAKEFMPYEHQWEMAEHILHRRQSICAGEMGTGKSLATIIALEHIVESGEFDTFWYVGPKSAVKSVERELWIWGSTLKLLMMTYEELVSRAKSWTAGTPAPQGIWFDESSRIKNPATQRSQAAKQFAEGVRDDWGDTAPIICTSGTPAPKSPADWWHQCEVVCPGFLKEGDINKFRRRLGVIVERNNPITMGVYPHLVTWRDDERKCDVCGLPSTDPIHDPEGQLMGKKNAHSFVKSVNEVSKLYRRLRGLVVVKFKKDCLDLPEKQFKIIEVKPTESTLRAAGLISKSSATVIEGLTRLRELSDGFQYIKEEKGDTECSTCEGRKEITVKDEVPNSCPYCKDNPAVQGQYGEAILDCPNHEPEWVDAIRPCPNCGGSGRVPTFERHTREVPCPKDDVLIQLLESHEESGRFVVFAGFSGSIDRCIRICHQQGWHTIRVDGRGWEFTDTKGKVVDDAANHLSIFQDMQTKYEKVVFVGHPKSGGMGVTLTASPGTFFFSNSFDGEDRTQAIDRIHRIGMDMNLGATIYDVIHLPSDRKVLDNLNAKRKLELMSLGELQSSIDSESERTQ